MEEKLIQLSDLKKHKEETLAKYNSLRGRL